MATLSDADRVARAIGRAEAHFKSVRERLGGEPTATGYLTPSQLDSGKCFTGYLYNQGVRENVYVDDTPKWLYAGNYEGAAPNLVTWDIHQDDTGNLYLITFIGGSAWFFNWRDSTGACKVYDSYVQIKADWDPVLFAFQILYPGANQYVGTANNSGNNELYCRGSVANSLWAFQII